MTYDLKDADKDKLVLLRDALLSGEYKQTAWALRRSEANAIATNRPERFCFMGVLCDVFMKNTGIGKWEKAEYDDTIYFQSPSRRSSGAAPSEVYTWLGFRVPDEYTYDILCMELNGKNVVVCNDDDKRTFEWFAEQLTEIIDV